MIDKDHNPRVLPTTYLCVNQTVKILHSDSTSERILAVATRVFHQKGMAGARMQDIADEAGINKALLFYYFKTKKDLFSTIFSEALGQFFPRLLSNIGSDLPLQTKIEHFCAGYIDLMLKNPHLPLFVLNEVNSDPQSFKEMFWKGKEALFSTFAVQVEKEYKSGRIKQISPADLFINMLSMCIFPFIAQPLWALSTGMDDQQFRIFMEQRKSEIPRFIIDSIKTQ